MQLTSNGMKIGFFDSGVGGLTIMRAVSTLLPRYDYVYYGDTKNVPFGDKPEAEIYELTKAGMESLFEHDCVLNIIACNTSSAESLRRLQDTYLPKAYPDRRILGVIIPAVEEVLDAAVGEVLLLATKRTIDSGKYERELGKRSDNPPAVRGIATPELVPLIEAGELDAAAKAAAAAITAKRTTYPAITAVILGCTHYTLLRPALQARFPDLHFISQDEFIPEKLNDYLQRHQELTSRLTGGGTRTITLTEHRPDYDHLVPELLAG